MKRQSPPPHLSQSSFNDYFSLTSLSNCHPRPLHSDSSVSQEKLTFGPRNSYTVEGLKPNTEYSFSLAAISNKGIGAFTNELVQSTSQASMSKTAANGLYLVKPFTHADTVHLLQLGARLSQPPERLQRLNHLCIAPSVSYQLLPLSSILTVPFLLPSASGFLTQPQQT